MTMDRLDEAIVGELNAALGLAAFVLEI